MPYVKIKGACVPYFSNGSTAFHIEQRTIKKPYRNFGLWVLLYIVKVIVIFTAKD